MGVGQMVTIIVYTLRLAIQWPKTKIILYMLTEGGTVMTTNSDICFILFIVTHYTAMSSVKGVHLLHQL